jgi:hemoglobin
MRDQLWFGISILAGLGALAASALAQPPAGEKPVDPYTISDANADATPLRDHAAFDAFHGEAGIGRVVDGMIDRAVVDPRLAEVFKGHDLKRLKRTLAEQVCYLLDGPCRYSGRDMKTAHKDLGIQDHEFNALVEDLQLAMDQEHVPVHAQNRLLAKLAPMHRDVVRR